MSHFNRIHRCTAPLLFALLFQLTLAGCSTLRGSPPPLFDKDKILSSTQLTDSDQNALLNAVDSANRNSQISKALASADIRYKFFVEDLISDRAYTVSGFSFAMLALNTAGASVASVAAKTNYALYSAATAGAQGIMDKNFFYEKTVAALILAMDAARSEKALQIRKKMTEDIDAYPGQAALSDIIGYWRAGSLEAALSQITKASEAEVAKNTAEALSISIPTKEEVADRRKIHDVLRTTLDLKALSQIAVAYGRPAPATLEEARAAVLEIYADLNKNRQPFGIFYSRFKQAGLKIS